jgi:hypothetical protein
MAAARKSRQSAPQRRAGGSAAERRRSERELVERAQRQLLMQQWQRAGVLLLMSASALLAGVPLLVLFLIGTHVDLGISERTASLWLMVVVAGWFGSLLFGLFIVSSLKEMERRARLRWMALLAFPVTTLPAAAVFAWRRRNELRPQVYPDAPSRRGWWNL